MKLHRLRITNFAAIGNVDIELGPGLNVLYGPNDLGKSTVVAAIRLGLLLPHNSTHCEQYVGWTGADDPVVEITFQTEVQRIWRIRKQFGKTGSSLLQESKNGQDFDDVERARKVDAKLREILRWGIPEPGGAGGVKGLPTSFLATALLSPQDNVSAVLRESLQNDPTGSGKEQIAAALQAIAQDPLFIALLRTAQAQRDRAYTPQGAKKTAKGSVFKDAAERLNQARDEKDRLHRIVADSEGAERQLRGLMEKRTQKLEMLAAAKALFDNLEQLASEATCRSVAADQVRLAQEEVRRIEKIGNDVVVAQNNIGDMVRRISEADLALKTAREKQSQAKAELQIAEEAARTEGSEPGVSDAVARQQLELRKSGADQAERDAQQRIDAVLAAKTLIDAVIGAEGEVREKQAIANKALAFASESSGAVKAIEEALQRCDVVERALELYAADQQAAEAKGQVDKEEILKGRLETISGERAELARARGLITAPDSGGTGSMRRLATELASARGALDVGFLVTVSPKGHLDFRIRRDGNNAEPRSTSKPVEIEANSHVEIALGDVATVQVRGGRRDAQERAQMLEKSWVRDVEPHLIAAGVTDIDGLDAKIAECRNLEAEIKSRDAEMVSLRSQLAPLVGAADALDRSLKRADGCRKALGEIDLDTLATDLKALEADPTAGLRKRRQQLQREADIARATANSAATAETLAQERARQSRSTLDGAIASRDGALTAFPEGVDPTLAAAKAALAASIAEKGQISIESTSLERMITERKKSIDAGLASAHTTVSQSTIAVDKAQGDLTTAMTEHATHDGRLIELKRLHDSENLANAEEELRRATERYEALPVPDHLVTAEEVTAARDAWAGIRLDLDGLERDIHIAQGALQQVGGAVARERLHDAIESFELAERQEREIEAEYEAWRLLLDQMKEADAAQAGNLGQALGPSIAGRFQELTQRRYQSVQLTAQLATEGIVVSGSLRSTDLISVGTREQLSTLYRLSLAEYLSSAIVLDDQLVQSDDTRMDWFRRLLSEKARSFQIVVLTCRPGDYLPVGALVPEGSPVNADTDGGFTRAIDLGRALRRR